MADDKQNKQPAPQPLRESRIPSRNGTIDHAEKSIRSDLVVTNTFKSPPNPNTNGNSEKNK